MLKANAKKANTITRFFFIIFLPKKIGWGRINTR